MKFETPAFPCTVKRNTSSDPLATPKEVAFSGMTLRDYFAGQALSGYADGGGWNCGGDHYTQVARGAYAIADAMMKEREK